MYTMSGVIGHCLEQQEKQRGGNDDNLVNL